MIPTPEDHETYEREQVQEFAWAKPADDFDLDFNLDTDEEETDNLFL
jgi:hypothetical protein